MLGLLLRLPSFNDSLFGDELATYFIVTDHSLGDVVDLLQGNSPTGDLSPPLFFMVAWLTEGLGGHAESLRIVSLLSGLAAIPLTYLLGLWTVGRRAALLGSLLIALSPFLIYYTTEARAYGLTLLLVLLSTLALLRALESGRFGGGSPTPSVRARRSTPTTRRSICWRRRRSGRSSHDRTGASRSSPPMSGQRSPTSRGCQRCSTTCESPGSKVIGFLSPFTLSSVRIEFGRWGLGHPLYPACASSPAGSASAMFPAGALAGLIGLVLRSAGLHGQPARPRPSSRTMLVFMLAVATPAGLILSSILGDSVWTAGT